MNSYQIDFCKLILRISLPSPKSPNSLKPSSGLSELNGPTGGLNRAFYGNSEKKNYKQSSNWYGEKVAVCPI